MEGSTHLVRLYHLTRLSHAQQIVQRGFRNYPMPSVLKHGVWLWVSKPQSLQVSEDYVLAVVEIDAKRIAPYETTPEDQLKLFERTAEHPSFPPRPVSYIVPASLLNEHGRLIEVVKPDDGNVVWSAPK